MNATNTVVTTDLTVDHRTSGGSVRALTRPSMTVQGGTSLAVMGPSGCGKSTLLGLLAGLALPTTGAVTIGDTEVSALDERHRVRFRRQHLGMVYQADNLLPHLTVEENVALSLSIAGEQDDVSDLYALLHRLGVRDLSSRFPDQLSGGQRQRVAVARAVVHHPTVILADEPTGSLDEDNARGVVELLVATQRAIGATLIMVTHDPAVANRADRVLQMGSLTVAGALADVD